VGSRIPPDDPPPSAESPKALFLANLDTIDRIVGALSAHYAMDADERDDFGAWVGMRLMEDDYAILRKHEGRSSLGTYLSVVIANLLRDRRIQKWGKWRPSAAARRVGPLGIRLERLIRRDGLSFDAAVQVLRSRNGVQIDERELARLAASFPDRSRPRIAPDADALLRAEGDDRADDRVLAAEQERHEASLLDALERSLAGLDDEDRAILKLRFWEGLTIADIGRALHLEQRPLYRRMDRLLIRLRASLASRGVDRHDVALALGEEVS
jgi:RNA polymerase sigma factor for flagellar operon FliA